MSQTFETPTAPSRHASVNGKRYLWFSGTDYLGMAFHPPLIDALTTSLKTLGGHYGSSRNNTLRVSVYRQAELALAGFCGAQDALMVSSGMLAAAVVRDHLKEYLQSCFPEKQFTESEAPLLHPALKRNPAPASEWLQWSKTTTERIKNNGTNAASIIYSDAIGTPLTTHFDFTEFKGLKDTFFVVDDSHGLGILGEKGAGSFRVLKQTGLRNLLVVASLNKALGIPGGVILGEKEVLDYFRQTAIYAGASPIPPAYAWALTQMIEQREYHRAHNRLTQNNDYFRKKIDPVSERFHCVPGYPVYTTYDPGLFDFLLEKNILASSFCYPSKTDPKLTRLVISSAHEQEDLDGLAKSCIDYYA